MLAVPTKEAKGLDWSGPLRNYLSNNYSSETLDKYSASIQRLSTTRERVANATGASASSVDALESYLVMLTQVEPRFPLGEGGLKLSFTWFDALKPSKKLSMSNVEFERASVLFNLAAVLSHQGMVQDRSDQSGLKKACQFFQRAAGVFLYLRDQVVGNSLVGPTTTDLSNEGLEMLYHLMLAQAQACFYEKAIQDKHKPAILSKLAAKAAEWYKEAYDFSKASGLAQTLDGAWSSHLEFQFRCFQASAQYQYSKVVHEQAEKTTEGYGEEIGRLALASELCEGAIHCARTNKLPSSMLDTVTHLRSVIHKTMDEATQNNNQIYMQPIPSKHDLDHPPSTALAKPIPVAGELLEPISISGKEGEVTENNLFAGLLPAYMQDAEAMYQSKLSELVEQYGKKVQDAAEEIKLRLAEANLPAAIEAGDGSQGLPDAVWQRLQSSVGSRGGIEGLQRAISSNEALGRKVENALNEIEQALNKEEQEDSRCRSVWGAQWSTSHSAELSMHMRSDVARYRGLLEEAKSSDAVLRSKLQGNLERMEILTFSRARLDTLFPTSEAIDNNPEVEATREDLALKLVDLGTCIQEAERLQGQLVDEVTEDSLAPALLRAVGGPKAVVSDENKVDALIKKEMGKYRPLLQEIDQKISDQPPLLSRVLDKNHQFSAMRNQSEAMLKREGLIAEIDQAITVFDEIVCFIAEGERFYMNLSGRIEQLRTTAMDHCYVREIQRKELESSLEAQAAAAAARPPTSPSGGGGADNSGYYPGMNRPGLMRENSRPFMQPYAAGGPPAPAYPVGQPAPAHPIAPPPPSYNQATAPPPSYSAVSGSSDKLALMRGTLGNQYSDAELLEALDGAGGDVNIAINHMLMQQEAKDKRKSKKRFGMF